MFSSLIVPMNPLAIAQSMFMTDRNSAVNILPILNRFFINTTIQIQCLLSVDKSSLHHHTESMLASLHSMNQACGKFSCHWVTFRIEQWLPLGFFLALSRPFRCFTHFGANGKFKLALYTFVNNLHLVASAASMHIADKFTSSGKAASH